MLKEGAKAPEFSGTDDRGRRVGLADFTGGGNVVLFFYPKAGTSG